MIVAATGTELATDLYMNGKKKWGHSIHKIKQKSMFPLQEKENQYLPSSFHVEWTIHFPLSAKICTVKNQA